MAPSVREGRGGGEARSGEKIQGAWPWGDGRSVCVRLRDMRVPLVVHVTHVLCFSLLSPHPVLRTHNLTVLPSHNSTFVRTNDSAYSNLSATVGEHLHPPVPCSVASGSTRSLEPGSVGLCGKALRLGGRSGLRSETRRAGKKRFTLGPDVVPLPNRKTLMLISISDQGLPSQLLVFRPRRTRDTF